MEPLSTTTDPAATYEVVAIVTPPQLNWLDLPALHQRLLPLALAAGHDRLLLSAHVGQGDFYYYEADAAGGPTGFRRYVSYFDYESAPEHFERELRRKLLQQTDSRPKPAVEIAALAERLAALQAPTPAQP